jgi:hypothetical protein
MAGGMFSMLFGTVDQALGAARKLQVSEGASTIA